MRAYGYTMDYVRAMTPLDFIAHLRFLDLEGGDLSAIGKQAAPAVIKPCKNIGEALREAARIDAEKAKLREEHGTSL